MGKAIGNSGSSKVMFMDPRNMMSTIEGVQSVIAQNNPGNVSQSSNSDRTPYNQVELDLERIKRDL